MNYLSIDYGLKHIGLAIAVTPLAEPYSQIKNDNLENVIKKLKLICQKESIDEIIVGISENQMLEKTREFIIFLEKNFHQKIRQYDETLSSHQAKQYLVASGAKKKKRQQKDHQIAAAIILQNYLDDKKFKLI